MDDEELIRHLVGTALQSYGYTVTEALSPEEASIQLSRSQAPYFPMMTDLTMPGTNGLALYKQAAERCSNLRVLYISEDPKHRSTNWATRVSTITS